MFENVLVHSFWKDKMEISFSCLENAFLLIEDTSNTILQFKLE